MKLRHRSGAKSMSSPPGQGKTRQGAAAAFNQEQNPELRTGGEEPEGWHLTGPSLFLRP